MLAATAALEAELGQQIDEQLERRECLIPGGMLRDWRDLKPRREIEFGLGVIAWFGEQRAVRAERGCGDDAGDVREPPAPLGREQNAHVMQRRVGIGQLLAPVIPFLESGSL